MEAIQDMQGKADYRNQQTNPKIGLVRFMPNKAKEKSNLGSGKK